MMTNKAVRNVRKLERPRPLKLVTERTVKAPPSSQLSPEIKKTGNAEDVMNDLEALYININNGIYDDLTLQSIVKVCNQLKSKGSILESSYKEQLDRYFVTLRNASREAHVKMKWRLKLLEIIELRAMGWKSNENISNYYAQKILEIEATEQMPPVSPSITNVAAPTGVPVPYIPSQAHASVTNVPQSGFNFGPGEVLKSSGKFAKPTKIAGKNYFKDEIVIRNSDSGKVMGIKGRRVHMIEELSDTIISFQRVNPGARDRLVQITGPNEDSINRARGLIADTIRRNASPVREKSEHSELEDVLRVSPTSLSSRLIEDASSDDVGILSGGKKQLVHSYSMGDASVGEYAYSVHVDGDLIKISGTKMDLVRTAKLVLEEYFAGQAELVEKQVRQQMDSHLALHHSSSMYMGTNNYGKDFDDWEARMLSSVQHSHGEPPSKQSPYLCNGSNVDREATSSISSDEETYKAEESSSPTEDLSCKESLDSTLDSPQLRSDSKFLTTGRVVSSLQLKLQGSDAITSKQPFLSSGNKEVFEEVEGYIPGFSDKMHLRFGEMSGSPSESAKCKDSFYSQIPILSPEECRISYSKDFLLDCSRSPLSHNPPRDLLGIASDMPSILRERSLNFNPDIYRKDCTSAPRDYCIGMSALSCGEGREGQDL